MLRKKYVRLLGKAIRRETSIPFPVAMRIGKMLAQGKSSWEIGDKFPTYVQSVVRCECCGGEDFLGYTDAQGKFREQALLYDMTTKARIGR